MVLSGVPTFVEHWGRGDNFQFYLNFVLFFNIGGMNLNQDFFQVSKLREDQKRKSFTNNGTLFSLNLIRDLRSDAHQSPIIGGMQM